MKVPAGLFDDFRKNKLSVNENIITPSINRKHEEYDKIRLLTISS